MRLNENTCLIGKKVILVPYKKEHVPLYHDWMGDSHILTMTASERLSTEEEYQNQISWHLDDHKLTFIILDREFPDSPNTGKHGGSMAGDCNLFFNVDEDDKFCAEIEIMIAEKKSRNKGLAKESLLMLMHYAFQKLKCTRFIAKILEENTNSIELFQKLGFKEFKRVTVFQEIHFEFNLRDSPSDVQKFLDSMSYISETTYE